MTANANNRYALFVEEDENASPMSSPTVDVSRSPFLNQIADDSVPWQQVKKRGAPTAQPPPASNGPVLAIRDQQKAAITQYGTTSRARATSGTTAETADKIYDPHENWCGVCSLKLPSKAALLSHVKQTPDHKHYCNLCKRVFKDRNGLKNHLENSLGHDVYCNLCLSAFNDEWGLKNHFENNYTVGHEFACLTCLLGFRTNAELERHLQSAEKHIWCRVSGFSVRCVITAPSRRLMLFAATSCARENRPANSTTITRHAVVGSATKMSAMSTGERLLVRHLDMERLNIADTCPEHKHCLQPGCDFDGPNQRAVDEHLKQDHFQCIGCKRIFPSQNKLNHHAETCTFAIACPQCNHTCAGQAELAIHLKNCFFCEECGFWAHHEGNFKIVSDHPQSLNVNCARLSG
jgi:hypothetical protein